MSLQLFLTRSAFDSLALRFRELPSGRFVTAACPEYSHLSCHVVVGAESGDVQIAAFSREPNASPAPASAPDNRVVSRSTDGEIQIVNGVTVGVCKLRRPQSALEILEGLDRAARLLAL